MENKNVPAKAHFVVIHGNEASVDAYVSFYREPLISNIRLALNYTGEPFKVGLICNWQDRNEQKFASID